MSGLLAIGCACLAQVGAPQIPSEVPEDLVGVDVRAIERSDDGALWFGTRDGGLGRLGPEGLRWMEDTDGDYPRGVADLAVIDGSLWAVGLGGASVLGSSGWVPGADLGDPGPRVVFGVSAGTGEGTAWLATSAGAIREGPAGRVVLTVEDGLPHAVVHDVVAERDGPVWLLCRTGLARWESGRVELVRTDLNFRAGLLGPDGRPWFGTSDGLLRWNGSAWDHELEGVTVYPKLVASDGAVWAGSAAHGAFRYQAGRWSEVPLPRLTDVEVFDIEEGPDGSIWVATAGGVVRLASAETNATD